MDPITLAMLAIGGLALTRAPSRRPLRASMTSAEVDRRSVLNEIRNMSFFYSNTFNSMPDLDDFLTVTGFREANFNPNVINPEIKTNPNAARGVFGFRPDVILKKSNGLDHLLKTPNILLNLRWSFVCAVYHIWDACDRLDRAGFIPNYAAIRRWWGIPAYVYDYDLENEYSRGNLSRFEKAVLDCNRVYSTNIRQDLIWNPILRWKNYPGMKTMIKAYGLD